MDVIERISMNLSRRIPAARENSLPKIERYFRTRGVPYSREDDVVHAELFRWSEFLKVADADQQSWSSLRLVPEENKVRVHFGYNWSLQIIAQALLSALVYVIVARFGVAKMLPPMLFTTNVLFLFASVFFAHLYAHRMTAELSAALAPFLFDD
jgi:hypothetical protein